MIHVTNLTSLYGVEKQRSIPHISRTQPLISRHIHSIIVPFDDKIIGSFEAFRCLVEGRGKASICRQLTTVVLTLPGKVDISIDKFSNSTSAA